MYNFSGLKTEKDGFNNLPERKEVAKQFRYLKEAGIEYRFVDIGDTESSCWKNDGATIVFALTERGSGYDGIKNGLLIGEMVQRLCADEFNHIINSNQLIVRLWWD